MFPNNALPPLDSVRGFIRDPDVGSFDALALDLFTFQFQNNRPYRNYCRELGRTPENTVAWKEIPAVPTSAFKFPAHPLTCGGTIRKTFLTSGTTGEIRGAHHFPETNLYELSLEKTREDAGLPALPTFFLAPSAAEAPQSSLSHMFEHFKTDGPESFLLRESKFQLAPLFRHLDSGRPLFLMGTALAFLHLIEILGPLALPPGSHLLETGGYKGTSRSLSKPDFYEQLSAFFKVPPGDIHNEYGMTELSTQAYANGPGGSHRFPPWCRPLILDPETSREVAPGKIGYLRLHDLANVHSVAAIRTQDFARGHSDGSFTLLGRDPGALPRGCSRTIDHALSS